MEQSTGNKKQALRRIAGISVERMPAQRSYEHAGGDVYCNVRAGLMRRRLHIFPHLRQQIFASDERCVDCNVSEQGATS